MARYARGPLASCLQVLAASFASPLRPVRPARRRGEDAGDVPGWVLIVLMTVALVLAVWQIAEPSLKEILTRAFNQLAGK